MSAEDMERFEGEGGQLPPEEDFETAMSRFGVEPEGGEVRETFDGRKVFVPTGKVLDPETGEVRDPITHTGEAILEIPLDGLMAQDGEAAQEGEVARPVEETILIVPEFPVSVAVVGAPGSGKRAFVEAFAAAWSEDEFFAEHALRVLPNPGDRIEELGQAVGFFGDYREHLLAWAISQEREMEARKDDVSYIVNGTALGNIAHAGANYETVMLGLQSSGLVTPDTQVRMQQLQSVLSSLTFLLEHMGAKFAFYLPLAPAIEIPGQDEDVARRHAQRVDNALQQVLAGFNMNLQRLDGTAEERAALAVSTIKQIMTEGVQVPQSVVEAAAASVAE